MHTIVLYRLLLNVNRIDRTLNLYHAVDDYHHNLLSDNRENYDRFVPTTKIFSKVESVFQKKNKDLPRLNVRLHIGLYSLDWR